MSDLMSDRELLELAANAAGYQVDTGLEDCPLIFGEDAGPDGPREWNPLANDGDALRLAVKLKIDIHQRVVEPRVAAISAMQSPKIESVADEKQRLAATRRAIVRAAAAIGEKMP